MFILKDPEQRERYFIASIVCFIIGLALLLFSLYLLPYLFFNFTYDVPEFVAVFLTTMQEHYEYSLTDSKILLWVLFFIPGLILSYISYYLSNLSKEKKPL